MENHQQIRPRWIKGTGARRKRLPQFLRKNFHLRNHQCRFDNSSGFDHSDGASRKEKESIAKQLEEDQHSDHLWIGHWVTLFELVVVLPDGQVPLHSSF